MRENRANLLGVDVEVIPIGPIAGDTTVVGPLDIGKAGPLRLLRFLNFLHTLRQGYRDTQLSLILRLPRLNGLLF